MTAQRTEKSHKFIVVILCWKVSLDSVLCLSIQESHGDEVEERQYSLEELRELMNKLMLMSGKVEQSAEVDRFSEVRFKLNFSKSF